MAWNTIAKVMDFEEQESKVFIVEGKPIIVSKIDGEFYAVDAICTHKAAYLPFGEIAESCVTCPIHFAGFDLKTGKLVRRINPLKAPDGIVPDLGTYEIRVEWDEIQIRV